MTNPWITAARPKTLPAGAAPVLLGLALSFHLSKESFSLLTGIITLLCTLLLQISSNLINDYYDGINGLDDHTRLGPPRATSLGLISAQDVKKGFLFTMSLAFILGLFLMLQGGWPIVIIGMASLFFAWAYTGGPFPLSYYGLGEVFAFIFFGPIAVWGTFYLQVLHFDNLPQILMWGCSVGILSSALMGINNLRDRNTDKEKGKHTLAIWLGNSPMRKFIFLLLIAAQIIAQYLLYQYETHHLYHLLGVTPLFLFSREWWNLLRNREGRELNLTLATVGKYIFLFSLSYSILLILL